MADDTEFEFVTASARRAARLQREYAEAFVETAAFDRRSIGEQFAALCTKIEDTVDEYRQRYSAVLEDTDRKLVLNAARELLVWTRELQQQRAWLEATASPPIDLGSLYYLSGLASALVAPDAELTVVATHTGSYATLVNPFGDLSRLAPSNVVLVALIPHREIESGLLHPLVAHEIGHGAAKLHNFTARLQARLTSEAVTKHFDEAAALVATQDSKRTPDGERAVLDRRFGSWVEEIFCDAFATACLGATYLFSFATEVLPDNVDIAGPKHPPTRQRVRLILEHLDRLDWSKFLDGEVPAFMSWVKDIAASSSDAQGPDDEALRSAIDLVGREIQDAVESHVGQWLMKPDIGALGTVAALLEQHVPPAQGDDGRAIDRPTIIAGCWISALKEHEGAPERLADAVDSAALRELLPYSLELSVIVDRWQTA